MVESGLNSNPSKLLCTSLRVTEDNLVFKTVQSGPYSSLNVLLLFKELTYIFFLNTARMSEIQSKLEAIEWSQHFSHCKSMGVFFPTLNGN